MACFQSCVWAEENLDNFFLKRQIFYWYLLHIYSVSQHKFTSSRIESHHFEGPTWSWSHGSWIYNYLCNQCLSPLQLRSNLVHDKVYSIHYVIKFVSDLRQVGDFLHVIWFPPPIKLTAMIYILSVENMNLDMTLNGVLLYIRVSSNKKKIQQTCNFKYSRLILILHGMKNNIIVEKLLNSMEDNKSSMIEQTSPLAPLKLSNSST